MAQRDGNTCAGTRLKIRFREIVKHGFYIFHFILLCCAIQISVALILSQPVAAENWEDNEDTVNLLGVTESSSEVNLLDETESSSGVNLLDVIEFSFASDVQSSVVTENWEDDTFYK